MTSDEYIFNVPELGVFGPPEDPDRYRPADFRQLDTLEPWVCKNCGRVGGFKLLGGGWISCSGCGAVHLVTSSGQVLLGGHTGEVTYDFFMR